MVFKLELNLGVNGGCWGGSWVGRLYSLAMSFLKWCPLLTSESPRPFLQCLALRCSKDKCNSNHNWVELRFTTLLFTRQKSPGFGRASGTWTAQNDLKLRLQVQGLWIIRFIGLSRGKQSKLRLSNILSDFLIYKKYLNYFLWTHGDVVCFSIQNVLGSFMTSGPFGISLLIVMTIKNKF